MAGGIWWASSASNTNAAPGQYDAFAQCLKQKDATFYGAWWCPHCKSQKALFGSSVQYLDYVECSTADGKSQLQICTDKGVKGYPTWQFGNAPLESGELTLQQLADKSGCALPVTASTNGNTNQTTNEAVNSAANSND